MISRSVLLALCLLFAAGSAAAQHEHMPHEEPYSVPDFMNTPGHEMWMQPLGGGWHVMGMGQIYPLVTIGAPGESDSPLQRTRFYPTQPAVMANLESPDSRFTLRTTLNFEGLTLPDGETTYGAWGEGFIDSRHPHTLLHELVLSINLWDAGPGRLSVSGGRGFATYGTDDPMGRPVQKFPTNHHLSQILERFFVGAAFITEGGWNLEASAFGGEEPTGPYDLSNIESFADSWAVRLGRRFGGQPGTLADWEATASLAQVRNPHGPHHEELITLYNAALRHAGQYEIANFYGLVEASLSDPDHGEGYYSILGEAMLQRGPHQPYVRLEYATRPEYPRDSAEPGPDFFRYPHDAHAIGATEWLISSLGYNRTLTNLPFIVRPFAEVQHHYVTHERGAFDPQALFGTNNMFSVSLGIRLFLGGDQMRMGTYGVLDPMTLSHQDHHHHMMHGH